MKKSFFLIDCDSFYASCEKVFRPDIKDKPVVVLSNNDGFIVAADRKAKALGIKTISDPYFKMEPIIKKFGIEVFSANFELYGDMSERVMKILARFSPEIEIYSIDEAFLLMNHGEERLTNIGRKIKELVWKSVGIPVSVGIGPTKTLAKIASRLAKKNPGLGGVFDIGEQEDMDAFLRKIKVEDIWGVGRAHSKLLYECGINTAYDLKRLSYNVAKKQMTIVGLKTVKELGGIPCFALSDTPPHQKSIMRSRSFGHLVETLPALTEAVASYTTRACEKLREQHSLAWVVHVFIATHPHKKEPQYSGKESFKLSMPTADTPTIIKAALSCLKKIYRPRYRYLRCGVVLTNLIPEHDDPGHLFKTPFPSSQNKDLMVAVDKINRYMGTDFARFGSVGIENKPWKMRQARRSQRYSTRWEEIPTVYAK